MMNKKYYGFEHNSTNGKAQYIVRNGIRFTHRGFMAFWILNKQAMIDANWKKIK